MNENSLKSLICGLKNLKQAGGVDIQVIKTAEQTLGLKFASDYIAYLENFGQIEANGIELTGLSSKMSVSVVKLTIRERKLGNVPDGFYIIEDMGIDGVVYAQGKNGEVIEIVPHRKPKIFASSLQEYIIKSQQI